MKIQKLFPMLLLWLAVLAACKRPADKSATDPQQLNHTWVLQSLQGQPIAATQAGRTPRLTFDLSQNRVSGHTGCNRLSGGATVKGDQIVFSRLITTKMACMGESMEQPFLSVLNDSTLTFTLQAGELTLLQGGSPVLVFKKEE
ncbi:MAG: META domain-containing protein [Adhaeribacter sp.]